VEFARPCTLVTKLSMISSKPPSFVFSLNTNVWVKAGNNRNAFPAEIIGAPFYSTDIPISDDDDSSCDEAEGNWAVEIIWSDCRWKEVIPCSRIIGPIVVEGRRLRSGIDELPDNRESQRVNTRKRATLRRNLPELKADHDHLRATSSGKTCSKVSKVSQPDLVSSSSIGANRQTRNSILPVINSPASDRKKRLKAREKEEVGKGKLNNSKVLNGKCDKIVGKIKHRKNSSTATLRIDLRRKKIKTLDDKTNVTNEKDSGENLVHDEPKSIEVSPECKAHEVILV